MRLLFLLGLFSVSLAVATSPEKPPEKLIDPVFRPPEPIRFPEPEAKPLPEKKKAAAPKKSLVKRRAGNKVFLSKTQITEHFAGKEAVSELLQSARAVPFVEKEKMTGFLFQQIEKNSILWDLGFRPGDLVKTVNKIELNSPASGLIVAQQLRDAKQVTVKLVRDKKPTTLEYLVE